MPTDTPLARGEATSVCTRDTAELSPPTNGTYL